MLRSISNENQRFKTTTDAKIRDVTARLVLRRELIERAWTALDEGWDTLQQRIGEAGIVSQSAAHQSGLLSLNLGGSIISICRSVLLEVGRDEPSSTHLCNLTSSEWDSRVPRDVDGCIVVDESSACCKYLIHKLLGVSGTATGMVGPAFGNELPFDEKAYLPHASRVLGLKENAHVIGMTVEKGSAVLKADIFGPMTAVLQEWCPGKPSMMKLLYRGSRDGWAGSAFHSRCGDTTQSTITLFRVSNGGKDSVVGGFSSVSWSSSGRRRSGYSDLPRQKASPGAFVFMLQDGTGTGSTTFHPTKWGIRQNFEGYAVQCDPNDVANFGTSDLSMKQREICTNNSIYDIPSASPFLMLNGRRVIEMEVFKIDGTGTDAPRPPPPARTDTRAGLINLPTSDTKPMYPERYNEDIRNFGVSVADSLMEERVALYRAHDELAQANAKAASSVSALVALYGQDVAVNKEDAAVVIELSVRGTRMTTLRSTLQACPDSAFAARFDADKWPPTDKDVDEHGRRVIDDCSSSVFSKILDVLRVRKRMAWATDGGRGKGTVRIEVKAADREAFKEFVHMYFTDHESFIMDLVQTP